MVTTLHTVLREPTAGQKQTLSRICNQSSLVVVQARIADTLLKEVYGVPDNKIAMIHHGAPDVPFLDPSYYKDQFQAEGNTCRTASRQVLRWASTLLGQHK